VHASFRRPGPPRPVIATGAFAGTLATLHAHGAGRPLDALGVALAAIACFALLATRRSTLGAFALSVAASAALNLIGYRFGPPIAPALALIFVAGDPSTRDRLPLTGGVVIGMLAIYLGAAVAGQHHFRPASMLGATALFAGGWIVGEQMRQRRQRIADYRERARLARRETEREQRLAVAEERNRIARDLHDSAAHAINVILVQAGAARLLQDRDPQAVREALTTIEDVARETIGEIDAMIRGLRERSGGDVEPPPGLAAVQALVERQRTSGLEIDVVVAGERRGLATSLDQAAYRIIQESLTNAARHGDGHAEVRIGYGSEQLDLIVSNGVAAGSANGVGGHGIVGMRERAELLGGTLAAGPRDGRFVVHATLPY
jgi:signal transduction histidine kinase